MSGDTSLAGAHHRVLSIEAPDSRATAARLTLIAGKVRIIEVGASRALEQIAGRCRFIAQLPRGTGNQAASEQTIVAPDSLIRGEIGIADQRTDSQAAFGRCLDPIKREVIDVYEVRRDFDLELHKIEQVRAAGN